MYRIFLNLYKFFKKHQILGFSILLLIIALTGFSASQIKLEEDITKLIPSGERQNVMKRILEETDFSDKIIVSISSKSDDVHPERLSSYARKFLDSVEQQLPDYVQEVEGRVGDESIMEVYNFVYDNLPLFLNNEDYEEISRRIQDEEIEKRLKDDYKSLISLQGMLTKDFIYKDPLSINSLGLEKLQELQVGDNFELYDDFVMTKDRKHLLLFISPVYPASETDRNEDFVRSLKRIQEHLNESYKNVEGDFFGGVLYSLANANRIKDDIRVTIGIAVTILLLLLIFFYRKIYVPLILFIPSIIGGLTAVTVLYFLKDSISAISVGIGAVLLGISLDYALHILTHYRNNRNIEQLYKEVSLPVLMSSFTTATAFLCLLFVKSEALKDLGIFAAVSVVVASVFALVLIPLLYNVSEDKKLKPTFLDRFASIRFYKLRPLVVAVLALFIAGVFFFTRVEFNSDISQLNFEPSHLSKTEKKIKEITGNKGKAVYLVAYGNTIDAALQHNNYLYTRLRELKEADSINSFSSIGGVVLSTNTQNYKIEQWDDFWTSEKKEVLKQKLIEKSGDYGFRPESFNYFYRLLNKDFDNIFLEDYRNTTNLYLNDFISTSPDFATVTTTVNLPEESSGAFVEAFRERAGIVAIDRKQLNQSFLGNLKEDFNRLIGFSIIAVFLILLIFYRNIEISVLTLLPIGITWVIALGIMAIFNIQFNILNIIISTFIFGLGLDYSIFITNAALKKYETGRNVLPTYQTSILISVITTLLGIGALVFAKHPALRSVSVVSVIGVLSALLVAFVLQTRIFNFLFIKRAEQGHRPFNIKKPDTLLRKKTEPSGDRLYHKSIVLDNYRYKSVYEEVRKDFAGQKERFLKVSNFIDKNDKVLQTSAGYGLLPVYLSYKHPEVPITAFEANMEKLLIAKQCFRSRHQHLKFTDEFSLIPSDISVFIIPEVPGPEIEKSLKEIISKQAEKVIILNPDIPHRWLLDLNFEISYRQNRILVFTRMS
ncbi:MMPL family transporter [Salegentibacter chungangensis]|uniref:MMPL family transporter n=1 Tax=Salegentibacter chungangensis TaxID=1335724 RepID=A0ABW3NQQ0_9FLAO